MKKTLMIAAAAAFMMTGLVATEAVAGGDLTKKCKACHATDKNKTGPSFKNIQAAYGDSATLAKVLEDGFVVADRRIAGNPCDANYKKYHKKAKMMSTQYKKLIKKKVEAGKFTYQALADEIFAK